MHEELLPPPTLLPAEQLVDASGAVATALANSASPLAWAALAEERLDAAATEEEKAIAYAFARTGYHRSLDRLRGNGWRGRGLVPFDHEPNQGVLRAIAALARASRLIGDEAEYERCARLLRDSDPRSVEKLLGDA